MHALILLGSTREAANAHSGLGDFQEAIRLASDERIEAARGLALTALGATLPFDSDERNAALNEASDVLRRIGDRTNLAMVKVMIAGDAIERGEWLTALAAVVDAADEHLQLGAVAMLGFELGQGGVDTARISRTRRGALGRRRAAGRS